jgi:hypothetical protein
LNGFHKSIYNLNCGRRNGQPTHRAES